MFKTFHHGCIKTAALTACFKAWIGIAVTIAEWRQS
jgi:hypothetical protein